MARLMEENDTSGQNSLPTYRKPLATRNNPIIHPQPSVYLAMALELLIYTFLILIVGRLCYSCFAGLKDYRVSDSRLAGIQPLTIC